MKNLFSLENPFVQMLSRIGDLIIINFLCLLCSLPIITAGAAISASHRIMQDFIMDNEGAVVKTFFRVFKENFKQATIAWLVTLAIIVALVADLVLIYFFTQGYVQTALYVILAAIALIVYGIVLYIFPLLTRYRNTLKQHLQNSMILMVVNLHRTLGMMLLHALPFIVLWFSYNVFLQTLVFWLFIGASFTFYMDTVLLKKVFIQLESK